MERIQSLSIAAGVLVLLLVGRLFQLSVFQYDRFARAADAQQVTEQFIAPKRGNIALSDASLGKPVVVAQTVERFGVGVTPRDVKRKAEYAALFASEFGLDAAVLTEQFNRTTAYLPMLVHGLTKEQAQAFVAKVNDLEVSLNASSKVVQLALDSRRGSLLYFRGGIYFTREYVRAYPEGKIAPHVLGFVDDAGSGRYGFEEHYQDALAGVEGSQRFERDSAGSLLSERSGNTSQDGTSYVLTIDRNVQKKVEEVLAGMVTFSEAEGGSVVVLNADTGAVVAMASYPDYAPGEFRLVPQEEQNRFVNRAISQAYESGSVVKPLAVAAAVDAGVTSSTEILGTFGSAIRVDGFEVNTAERKAFGAETAADVLANSDNVAMVAIANALGNEKLHTYYQRIGLGEQSGIDLQGEVAGTLRPLKEWRGAISRATASFGQGLTMTPLQLALAYAPFVNGGYTVAPHVVQTTIRSDGTTIETGTTRTATRVLKEESAVELQRMLTHVVEKTHRAARIPGYTMGGKTGTAQIAENGVYLEGIFNHTFTGIGPLGNDNFVLVAHIQRPNSEKVGLYAQSTAQPVYKDIATFLTKYYQVAPNQ